MIHYIHQKENWTNFTWKESVLPLAKVRYLQGQIQGKMEILGFHLRQEALLETLTLDVLKSTEIEGELLNPEQVRSSLALRLGMDIGALIHSDRNIDGVVEMMLDATQNSSTPLTQERLFNWHAALFPTGRNGLYKIEVGTWRTNEMQVVSGVMGKEKIHFQALPPTQIKQEMDAFINWFNADIKIDSVIKAGIAHLWFVTIHPFDDGNGRITRAITDMQLSRSDGNKQRFFSMSSQIRKQRNEYYTILEKTQRETTSDITAWLNWFLLCMMEALLDTDNVLEKVIFKAKFWQKNSSISLNDRQRLLLNKVLDGFNGNLTSSKWAKIGKCSADTALRDIQDLMQKDILQKEIAGGRSTNYILK